MATWAEITTDPRYAGLSAAGKEELRAQYAEKYPDAKDVPSTAPAPAETDNPALRAFTPKINAPEKQEYNPDNSMLDSAMELKDRIIKGTATQAKPIADLLPQAFGAGPAMDVANQVANQQLHPQTLSGLVAPPKPAGSVADQAIDAAQAAVTDASRLPSNPTMKKVGDAAEFLGPMALDPALAVLKTPGMAAKALAFLKSAGLATATGGGAVEGGEAAQAMGASKGSGEIVGGLLGGVITPAVLSKYPNFIKMLFNPEERAAAAAGMKDNVMGPAEQYVEGQVKKRIATGIQDAGPQAAEDLQRADELKSTIPGWQPNLGQATGASGIIADQNKAIAASPKAFDAARQAEQSNAEALQGYLKTGKGDGERAPKAYLDQAVQDNDKAVADIETNAQNIRDKARTRALAMQSDTQPAEAGAAIKEAFTNDKGTGVKDKLDSARNAMYESAGDAAKAEGANYTLAPVTSTVKAALTDPHYQFAPGDMPQVAKVLDNIGAKAGADAAASAKTGLVDVNGKPLQSAGAKNADDLLGGKSYDDMTALLRAARDDKKSLWSNTSLTNGQKQVKSQTLDSIIDNVNGQITRNPDFPETAAKHLAADQFYKDVYAPRVRQGATADLMKTDKDGASRVIDENVLKHYTSSAEGAKQFVTTFGKGSDALAPVVEHMRDKYYNDVLKKFVDSDGHLTLRPADAETSIAKMPAEKSEKALTDAHNQWMRRNGGVIDELDKGGAGLRDSLGTTHKAMNTLGREQFEAAMNRKQLDEDSLGKLLHVNRDNIEGITDTALKDPAAMGRLTAKLATVSPNANRSLARSVMNNIADKLTIDPGQMGVDPAKMGNVLKNNTESLQTLFKAAYGHTEGMRQFRRLTDVFDALKMQARAIPKQGASESTIGGDPLRAHVGFTVASLAATLRGITMGRGSMFNAGMVLGGQAAATKLSQVYNRVQQEILADPERTQELLKLIKMEQTGKSGAERYKQTMRMLSMGTKYAKQGIMYYAGTKYMPKLIRYYGPMAAGQVQRDQDARQ